MSVEPGLVAPLRLLVVEDNPDDVELIRLKLEGVATDRRFVIETVDRLSTAVRRLKGADVVLLDLGLHDSGGIDAVARLSNEAPEIPLVVLTGRDDSALGLSAVREGAQDSWSRTRWTAPCSTARCVMPSGASARTTTPPRATKARGATPHGGARPGRGPPLEMHCPPHSRTRPRPRASGGCRAPRPSAVPSRPRRAR